jgi:membrane protein YfhO
MRRPMDPYLLALALLVLTYNLPQLLSGSLQYDGLEVHYAAQKYLSDELHAGRLPVWTPYIFSGFPFLADLQVAAWYPLNWPFLAGGIVPRSIGAELALDGLIATLGTYLLAAQLLQNKAAAATAAVLYGCSGWFAAHAQHVGMVATAAWLPWLLLLLKTLQKQVTWRKLALAGLLGAAIALPGHFQLALYTVFFVAIWAAVEALAARSRTTARRMAVGLVALGIWGGLLAAVMILPAAELVSQSDRGQLNALALPDIGYFHPAALATLVYPDFYGLLSGRYIGPGDSTQHYFYSGILLVPLVLLGARNLTLLRTGASLSLPFLWYALGPAAGLYRLMARLPGFASVELPMHGWFLVALGLALLGGAGASVVQRRLGCRWGIALLIFIAADVLIVNQLLNPLAYARDSFQSLYGAQLAEFQAEARDVSRLYGPELAEVAYRNHALQSRVETTYGYNPLELAAYAQYASAAERNPALIDGFAASHALVQGQVRPLASALPLAYFAAAIAPDSDGALANLDPATETLVNGELPRITADAAATVSVTDRGPDWLGLRYASKTTNLIRVAIPFYPGWTASLNGAPLELVRVDRTFIGIVAPAGEGEVRLSYAPRLLLPGAAISLIALLAAAAALLLPWARRK